MSESAYIYYRCNQTSHLYRNLGSCWWVLMLVDNGNEMWKYVTKPPTELVMTSDTTYGNN